MSDTPVPSRLISTSTEDSLVARSSRAGAVLAVVLARPCSWRGWSFCGVQVVVGSCIKSRRARRQRPNRRCPQRPSKDRAQPVQEGGGFRLRAGGDAQVAGDADVADQHAGVQQTLPDGMRIRPGRRRTRSWNRRAPAAAPVRVSPSTIRSRWTLMSSTLASRASRVAQRRHRGGLGDGGEVVGQADQPEGVGDLRCRGQVAQPGAGQGEGLAHGAGHDQPLPAGQQGQRAAACRRGRTRRRPRPRSRWPGRPPRPRRRLRRRPGPGPYPSGCSGSRGTPRSAQSGGPARRPTLRSDHSRRRGPRTGIACRCRWPAAGTSNTWAGNRGPCGQGRRTPGGSAAAPRWNRSRPRCCPR